MDGGLAWEGALSVATRKHKIQIQFPLPHLPGSQTKRLRRIFEIWLQVLGYETYADIKSQYHRAHQHLPSPTMSPPHFSICKKMQRNRKMYNLIRSAYHISPCRVTSSQFCIRKSCSYQLGGQPVSGLWLYCTAGKMNEVVGCFALSAAFSMCFDM